MCVFLLPMLTSLLTGSSLFGGGGGACRDWARERRKRGVAIVCVCVGGGGGGSSGVCVHAGESELCNALSNYFVHFCNVSCIAH